VDHHISLKHQHGEFNRFRKGMGMAGALAEDGFSLEGTHHRGIDDARNISKIFLKHFEKWTFPASA
jgi:inhibitor of KinA sporulation pathway (predicted exonuclease)